jgi:hypothetical protein
MGELRYNALDTRLGWENKKYVDISGRKHVEKWPLGRASSRQQDIIKLNLKNSEGKGVN